MNVDFFDLYHAVVKSLPWPEEAEKWAESKPSRRHALEALRKLGSQGVSSVDKLDPLIERILKAMQEAPHSVTRGTDEPKMEMPHKPGFPRPERDDGDELKPGKADEVIPGVPAAYEHKEASRQLPDPKHAGKAHH